jgi:hypothetical protein
VLRLKVMLDRAEGNLISENQEDNTLQEEVLYMEKSKLTSRLRDN